MGRSCYLSTLLWLKIHIQLYIDNIWNMIFKTAYYSINTIIEYNPSKYPKYPYNGYKCRSTPPKYSYRAAAHTAITLTIASMLHINVNQQPVSFHY